MSTDCDSRMVIESAAVDSPNDNARRRAVVLGGHSELMPGRAIFLEALIQRGECL